MKIGRKTAVLGLVLIFAVAVWFSAGVLDGPWGMIPGGRFEGPSETCAPHRLAEFAKSREVAVEVDPANPRSVTTWFVESAGEYFLPADFLTPWKRWPHQVMEDDRIRIRVGGTILDCRAERVSEAAQVEALRRAIAEKYDIDPVGRAAGVEVWWFRVRPR